jgi:hypothetical protein
LAVHYASNKGSSLRAHIVARVAMFLHICPHTMYVATTIYVSSYYYICVLLYICVLILLYMCPHTPIHVHYSICPHTTIYVATTIYASSYYSVCSLKLLVYAATYMSAHHYICGHITIYVASYYSTATCRTRQQPQGFRGMQPVYAALSY